MTPNQTSTHQQALLHTALAVLAAGVSLVPVSAVTKRPIEPLLPFDPDEGHGVWKPYQSRQPMIDEVRYWIAKEAQIAAVAGAISGNLLVLDFDEPRFWAAWHSLVAPLLAGLPIQQTGGGGVQVFLRCDDPGHNDKLAHVPDTTTIDPATGKLKYFDGRRIGIETRGEGGYAVIPPSLHPSGNHYAWLQGDLTSIPYVDQTIVDQLLAAARSLDEAPYTLQQINAMNQAMHPSPPRQATNGSANVIDLYNAATPIEQALRDAGYTHCFHDRWAPPGAGKRDSVTVKNSKAFHYDTNFPLADGYWHDAFSVWSYYRHNSDTKAAVKEAAVILCLPVQPQAAAQPTPAQPPPAATAPPPQGPAQAATAPSYPGVALAVIPPMPPEQTVRDCYADDESGDARLLHALYANRLAYDTDLETWYAWSGNNWMVEDVSFIRVLIEGHVGGAYLNLATKINNKAAAEPDPHTKAQHQMYAQMLQKRAHSLHRLARLNNIVMLAQYWFRVKSSTWDADPYLLGVQNGAVDLRNGKLIPSDPSMYIRRTASTAFIDLDTPAPRWEQFLEELFTPHTEYDAIPGYLSRLFGYSLLGLVRDHILVVFWGGQGRNGKGTMLQSLQRVLGAYAGPVPNDLIIDSGRQAQGGAAAPHWLELQGMRLVWGSEVESGSKFSLMAAKRLSGGDLISARAPYGKTYIKFSPSHQFILLANDKPRASSEDDAFWDRLQIVPFTMRFLTPDRMTGAANERPADPGLEDALVAEAPGILAWLVRGCLEYQRVGIQPPEVVKIATQAYRDDEDTLGMFIAETCIESPMYQCGAQELFNSYRDWCVDSGINHPMKRPDFYKRMDARHTKIKTNTGNKYVGLAPVITPPSSP